MARVEIELSVAASTSFRCQKAANSVDLDVAAKLTHRFALEADLESPFNVGLIFGASGSGKTTLARHVWGEDALKRTLDPQRPVIDQFPDVMSYKDCVRLLTGVGLSQVPCWIRPAWTLSNGQRERAEIALKMAAADTVVIRGSAMGTTESGPVIEKPTVVIDEWTSVVDRTVAKVMSHCVQKWARKTERRVVLLSCHADVVEWLDPDWVVECNTQTFDDRRGLRRGRAERLTFEIRECDRSSWRAFRQYHYLSDRLPGGHIETFGLYLPTGEQIGFQCFANYTPPKYAGRAKIMHSNRTVIHPDYVGLGLGMRLIDETSEIMTLRGYDVRAKYSSQPVFEAMRNNERWKLAGISRPHKIVRGGNMIRSTGFRLDVTTYEFSYVPRCRASGS